MTSKKQGRIFLIQEKNHVGFFELPPPAASPLFATRSVENQRVLWGLTEVSTYSATPWGKKYTPFEVIIPLIFMEK